MVDLKVISLLVIGIIFSDFSYANRFDRMIDYDQFRRCVKIPEKMKLCGDLQYTTMTLPNLLGHETLKEVLTQASYWSAYPSMLNCHSDAKTFLCSLFSPVCLPAPNNSDQLIDLPPCNSLCKSVRNSCKPSLEKTGLVPNVVWTTMFNCSNYKIDEGLCVPGTASKQPEPVTRTPARQNTVADIEEDQSRAQCSICNYKPSIKDLETSYCAPPEITAFVVKLKKIKVQHIRRRKSKSSGTKSYLKLSGGLKYYSYRSNNKNLPRPTEFFLPKPKKCMCDMLRVPKTEFLIMGSYDSQDQPIVRIIQTLSKNRSLRRMLRRVTKPSQTCGRSGTFHPAKLLTNHRKQTSSEAKKQRRRNRKRTGNKRGRTGKTPYLSRDLLNRQ